MIVTITGSNDFARTQELKKLVTAFVAEHTDMALERFDGEEATAASMQGGVASMPFLTARKMVVLREPSKQKAFTEHFTDILKEVADTTDLIIVEPKLDKRLSYYKTLKKETDFKEFNDLDANGLAQWAAGYAKEKAGSLSTADARILVDRVGPNQQLLSAELEKLLAYDPAITKQAIERLIEPMPQSTVFELLDAAFAGRVKRTMELYHEQRALKVEPQAIIAMLGWQLHVLAVVTSAGSRSPDVIAREGKLNPYVVRKTQGLTRNLSLERVKQMIDGLLALDRKLKSVSIDADEALQLYLIQLANR
ncbi:MAG TPA: DNA polymerase III subunit delta [Candidatus Saccharimonadales bacterium]|jgi:DNA polymerase-3 subunit delta|nr:DNA polymerase III subunit delta [Candidatus Saccharimonadales bacterium]